MNQDNIDIQEVLQEKEQKKKDEKYNAYVKNHTPKKSWCINLLKAYAIGGFICVVGQALSNAYMSLGMEKETAGLYTTLSLIFLSVLFTGLNLYQKLANFAGAGTIVPITGFANSVVSPALWQKPKVWCSVSVQKFSQSPVPLSFTVHLPHSLPVLCIGL